MDIISQYAFTDLEAKQGSMILDNDIVIKKGSYYILEVNPKKNRTYLTLLGYWKNYSDLSEYLNDIKESLKKMSPNFTLLVDLTHYHGTLPQMNNLHVEAYKLAIDAGLSRVAEVFSTNPFVKMFFEIYSKESGTSPMSFRNIEHAEKWLNMYL